MKITKTAAAAAIFIAILMWSEPGRGAEEASSSPPSSADQQTKEANAKCLACHSEAGLNNPPRADMHLEGLANLLISAERFEKSVHGEEACKDCHGDSYVQYPHVANSRYQIKMCPECHKSAGRRKFNEFKQTLHYINHPHNFSCVSCHNPHTLQRAKQLGSAKRLIAQDNGMCRDCHDSDQRYGQFTTRPRPDLVEVHKWQPNPELHWKSVRCIDCHTPPSERGGTSHVILGKDKAERDCVVCHSATSSLRTRLYRYFAEQGQIEQAGFLNGAVLSEAYVVGATRNIWLDRATWVITGLLLAGIVVHGLLRIVASRLQKRRK